MLPFLQPKKITSILIAKRGKPAIEAAPEVEAPESDMDPALKSAAEDILSAIERKSVMDLAKALRAAHEICESICDDEDGEDQDDKEMV